MAGQDRTAHILAEIAAKAQGRRAIVFVSGNFNVVHPGHLRLLQFAADCGDFLVVGVNVDKNPAITVPASLRLEGIRAISIVDFAFLLEEKPEDFIRRLRPAAVLKGKEFETQENPERAAVESYGGKLLFGSGEIRFSSIDLLRREFFEMNYSTIRKPKDFLERHRFGLDELVQLTEDFRRLRVTVIGDLIVDEYIDCEPLGMSQEDPTIVVTPLSQQRFVGGAGVVAAHTAGLGSEVRYFGFVGHDEAARFAEEWLADAGVQATLLVDGSRPTTLKQRYRAQEKTLLKVSRLRQHDVSAGLADSLFREVESVLNRMDLIIFSDFNYGGLPQTLLDRLVERGLAHGVVMTADSQSSSQIGDISRFRGMRLLTPTEHEARIALRDHTSGLAVLADALRRKAQAQEIFITLGAEGMLIHGRDSASESYATDQIPAFNTAPRDVAGAGDSLLTSASLALAAGGTIWKSAYLGSLAAACQVSRLGNSPLSAGELIMELRL